MGKRKVTILDPAIDEVARVAFFIEGKGMPSTAKKFVDEAFVFFDKLSDERVVLTWIIQMKSLSVILHCRNF